MNSTLIAVLRWTWSKYLCDAALTRPPGRPWWPVASTCAQGELPFIGNSTRGGPGGGFGVFDGIDLDREWPASVGSPGNIVRPSDRENYTLLAAEFRRQLDAYGASAGRRTR